MLRKLLIGVAVIATIVAGVGTARLVLPRADPTGGVVKQLAFLRAEIEGGADHAAQKQYPEGYFFLNALYGLTWVQVGLADPDRSVDAAAEVRWALDRLQSADATAPFDASLRPQYGVFYAGWTNWLRGGLVALKQSDAAEIDAFTSESVEIATAFRTAKTPVSSVVSRPGLAGRLGRRDRVAAPVRRSGGTAVRPDRDELGGGGEDQAGSGDRIAAAPGRAGDDRRAGVVASPRPALPGGHRSGVRAGAVRDLPGQFVTGVGVREYPKGVGGKGDADSGPLILGMSLSASVVTIGRGPGPARSAGGPARSGRRPARAPVHRPEDEAVPVRRRADRGCVPGLVRVGATAGG